MRFSRSKTTAIRFSLFLMFAMVLSLIALPVANAHDPPWTVHSYAYLVPAPDPVGVGQRVLIVMWIDTPIPSASVNNDRRRHDYKLTITAPDDSKDVFTWDLVQDPTGVQYVSYTPDQAGTYTLLFEYPEQVYEWSGSYANDVFSAASKETTLTVQNEPLPEATTSYPLPTEYWTRPIEGQNTDWYTISSNWLGEPQIESGQARGGGTSGNYVGRVQHDGIAPNSPHIMWTKPLQNGGVVGGNGFPVPGTTYYNGGSYNTRWSNALIMHGRLYYELPLGNSGSGGGWICVDLRTGEEIWYNPLIGASGTGFSDPAFGYLYDFDSPNQHGVIWNGLLFQDRFRDCYDPVTGNNMSLYLEDVPNVPRTATVLGPHGEHIKYEWSNSGRWLAQWNSSRVFTTQVSGTRDASDPDSYDWNVTLPTLDPGSWRVDRANLDDMLLMVEGSFGAHPAVIGATPSTEGANVTAISLEPGNVGRILWTKHYDPAPNDVTRAICNWDPEVGVFIMHDKETRVHWGFSLENGNQIWGPTEPANDYTYFRNLPTVAYHKIYFAGYGGIVYCHDTATGELLWTYGNGGEGNSTFSGLETAWGHYPVFIDVVADGKIYLSTTEHSPGSPFYKDSQYRCINATTGEEIWTMMGWGTGMDSTYDRVADGFFVFLNCYDMQVYCVGKGPSATAVKIEDDVIAYGDSALVKGTVLDIAAGTEQHEQAARFPYGVPAVSDESMSDWMEYVYMQKPRPADVVGVDVTVSVLDPNGNVYDVDTVASDASGTFVCEFVPEVAGLYTVTAAFAGSESYWPSNAVTYLKVNEAPAATPSPTPTPASMAELYFMPVSIAIIVIVIAIGAVLIILMLRKR
jgi:outer membrane protein assembly factor BamB